MMSGTGAATNFGKSLEDTNHTGPILGDEGSSLCLNLLIMGAP
jgi:hypothetical protein